MRINVKGMLSVFIYSIIILSVWTAAGGKYNSLFAENVIVTDDSSDKNELTADNYKNKGMYELAAKYYKKAGMVVDGYKKIGEDALSKGRNDAAALYFALAEDHDGLKQVGDIFFGKGDYTKAERCYLKAGINKKEVYDKIADNAFNRGKYDDAADYYKKADDRAGLIKTGEVYTGRNEYEKAAQCYINAGKDKKETYIMLADNALKKERYDDASALYIKAEDKEGLGKICEVYYKRNEYEKAARCYIKSGMNKKDTYNKIADEALNRNNTSVAVKYYKSAGNNKKVFEIESKYIRLIINRKSDFSSLSPAYDRRGRKTGNKKSPLFTYDPVPDVIDYIKIAGFDVLTNKSIINGRWTLLVNYQEKKLDKKNPSVVYLLSYSLSGRTGKKILNGSTGRQNSIDDLKNNREFKNIGPAIKEKLEK